ncbi:hypothetical protein QOZ88_21785 [Blastococcus sp. BMG 814]|uniref:Acyltransferase n=1 Tax=Blastococcus carthaginiensis TaxID=3050034 RepID=A0ABT9II58_9ACTN|nr:hypothetical protein [Blastococcus carthaginiensis]MDP5185273.1 hypothetical protein [Blastococcus carthaginiensis]
MLANLDTRIAFFDIAGTPQGVPYPGAWNGSVWTLQWEMAAYAGLLLLAVLRLTRHRWFLLALAAVSWILLLFCALDVVDPGGYRLGGLRFALMFLTGACLYAFARRVPVRGWLAGLSVVAIAAGGFLSDYRLIAAPALAYLVFWIGSRLRHPRWNRRTDLSFGLFLFGFPVQQLLLTLGWDSPHPLLFFVVSVLATLPLGLASWFAVERPAMNWSAGWIDVRPTAPLWPAARGRGGGVAVWRPCRRAPARPRASRPTGCRFPLPDRAAGVPAVERRRAGPPGAGRADRRSCVAGELGASVAARPVRARDERMPGRRPRSR